MILMTPTALGLPEDAGIGAISNWTTTSSDSVSFNSCSFWINVCAVVEGITTRIRSSEEQSRSVQSDLSSYPRTTLVRAPLPLGDPEHDAAREQAAMNTARTLTACLTAILFMQPSSSGLPPHQVEGLKSSRPLICTFQKEFLFR